MEQRKYQKTYELKQVIKAYAEFRKQLRLNRKLYVDDIHIENLKEARKIMIELLKKYDLVKYGWGNNSCSPKYDIRLLYIAYGLLRKKPYNVIEQPREENALTEYDWKKINEIMEIFKEENVEVENV